MMRMVMILADLLYYGCLWCHLQLRSSRHIFPPGYFDRPSRMKNVVAKILNTFFGEARRIFAVKIYENYFFSHFCVNFDVPHCPADRIIVKTSCSLYGLPLRTLTHTHIHTHTDGHTNVL
uniref:(northern house mosquito) hypothetical protein n=1 Tax=Culex pipiens TaxID=7175 RepID=A0A8D8K714_CULPI